MGFQRKLTLTAIDTEVVVAIAASIAIECSSNARFAVALTRDRITGAIGEG